MYFLRVIVIVVLFFIFQTIVTAHEEQEDKAVISGKIVIGEIIVNDLVFVSKNGTRARIVLGDDGRFYITAIASPPEEYKEKGY